MNYLRTYLVFKIRSSLSSVRVGAVQKMKCHEDIGIKKCLATLVP